MSINIIATLVWAFWKNKGPNRIKPTFGRYVGGWWWVGGKNHQTFNRVIFSESNYFAATDVLILFDVNSCVIISSLYTKKYIFFYMKCKASNVTWLLIYPFLHFSFQPGNFVATLCKSMQRGFEDVYRNSTNSEPNFQLVDSRASSAYKGSY